VELGYTPQATNICTPTFDVQRFSFEPEGVLKIDNEYSGHAV